MLHVAVSWVVGKLPPSAFYQWAWYTRNTHDTTLRDFGNWIGELADSIGALPVAYTPSAPNTTRPDRPRAEQHSTRRTNAFVNVHATETQDDATCSSGKVCAACDGQCSVLTECKTFLSLNVKARWAIVTNRKACSQCLRWHRSTCRVSNVCGQGGCTQKHHTLLHSEKVGNRPASTTTVATAECNVHVNAAGGVLLRYVPIVLHGKGRTVKTYALLDDGSFSTFIEHDLVAELGLSGAPQPLCINWTGNQKREEAGSVRLAITLSGAFDGSKRHKMSKVHTLEQLALPEQSLDTEALSKQYKYLMGAQAESYADVKPRVLIGADNCRLGQAMVTLEGKANQPIATKTRLGWIVYGPCSSFHPTVEKTVLHHSINICPCADQSDDKLHSAVKEFFAIESLGISSTTRALHSKDDERALEILKRETRIEGSRFETGLLWRCDNVRLPCNKDMAMKRYECLKKRMLKDPELAKAITQKMTEYEAKGYIRRLTESEKLEKHPRDWYLPIFPVTNPNKPGKLRMVFDAAAKVRGVSLNTHLVTGPDQLTSLLSVLFKFREYHIAVAGDIREMFFQVKMKKEDQRSQMFLWGDQGNNAEPATYAVAVMTFSAACSPSSAQYVKNINAERFEEQFPRAVSCIKNEHYVDDMLTSVETEEEAIELAEQVRLIHAQGGFEIRNWVSNSFNVAAHLRKEQPCDLSLNMCSETHKEKVLGMWWDIATDSFTFRLSPKHDKQLLSGERFPTKREVLRTLMMIYDPMGLIGCFLIFVKILLQEIWRAGLGWDQEIIGTISEKWSMWVTYLPEALKVSIPRCYRNTTSASVQHVQLHVFCDASEYAMATVAYFRFKEGDTIECALIGSKTRVAPIKFASIPRLELQAALIGSRFSATILQEHRINIAKCVYWTDSKNVISWLRSDHRRYSQFVAFRVGEILEHTEVTDWRWLPTKMNVADEGTKWQRFPDLGPSSRWFRGPDFLREPEQQWPGAQASIEETAEELRPKLLHHSVTEPLILFDRFSRWKRLLRAIAYVLRFANNLRKQSKREPIATGPLNSKELEQAERAIFITAQRDAFPEEIQRLSDADHGHQPTRSVLNKDSTLFRLSPEIDDHGVLRSRSRLINCPWIDDYVKRPIILPRNHRATALLLADFHERYMHINHQTAINQVREKFHIPRINSEFNRVRRSCQYCKVHRANPDPPLMGNLPMERLAAFQQPFTYTGVDYFGPMHVAVGRRSEKRWGVIFTCLTTRGIHLEVVHTLNTSSCILALRRFIARKGMPVEIRSDCGTNFVGASRELKEVLQNIDRDKLMEEFNAPGLTWVFNPPGAPHFGGGWERLIQSVKRCIGELQMPRLPTDEILETTLAEIEVVINSRPLTHVPLDNESDSPLTPNHFLFGSSNGTKPPVALDDGSTALRTTWKTSQQLANRPL
ncbi:uncharacterized protein LOC131293707 [Anopheles ziemanni]|uniref:uncharacterized protein LOC131264491 n=1 Tax=Anopheles coustani TaxID=139045 RepID=UPI002659EECF|nr:uncharacterized protein LOC131264491 [Anopheles coustani]XP_058177764.1 uncharacterized protein LOC131293707 [Anopheles ziemanni]